MCSIFARRFPELLRRLLLIEQIIDDLEGQADRPAETAERIELRICGVSEETAENDAGGQKLAGLVAVNEFEAFLWSGGLQAAGRRAKARRSTPLQIRDLSSDHACRIDGRRHFDNRPQLPARISGWTGQPGERLRQQRVASEDGQRFAEDILDERNALYVEAVAGGFQTQGRDPGHEKASSTRR